MREKEFRAYLEDAEQISSKDKAVSTRVSRANAAEEICGVSLDDIVADDNRMYEALLRIHADAKEKNGNIQNAVRWYYRFANGREFPKLSSYHCTKRK